MDITKISWSWTKQKFREAGQNKEFLKFETTKLRSKTIKEKKVRLCNLSVWRSKNEKLFYLQAFVHPEWRRKILNDCSFIFEVIYLLLSV